MIHIFVRFALLLKDDFSAATIADGGQQFFVNGHPARPIRKPDGFFVFTAPPGSTPDPRQCWDVRIESARYFPRTVHVDAAALAPGMPLCTVRMYRRPHSGFADCEWMEAQAAPGMLAVALVDEDPPLALKGFSKTPCAVYLRGYTTTNLLGQRICVGEGAKAELFVLTARHADGGYAVDHLPGRSHREGEPIHLASCAPAQADGRCSIPLRPGWMARVTRVKGYDEEAMRWRET